MTRVQTLALVAVASLAAHVWMAVGIAAIKKPKARRTPTPIEVRATKKRVEPKKAPEPPPPPPVHETKAQPIAKAAPPRPAPKAAPVAEAKTAPLVVAGLPELGVSMGNGPGGIAVPVGGGPATTPTLAAAPTAKVLATKGPIEECADPPAKPKPLKIVQPAYTPQAREAQIEGRVRVEITVDELGRVAKVRVLSGLGHGLDEAALEAARASSFEAAMRCGKTVASTFVIGMRFAL